MLDTLVAPDAHFLKKALSSVLFSTNPIPMVILDMDGVVIDVNMAFATLFQVDEGDSLDLSTWILGQIPLTLAYFELALFGQNNVAEIISTPQGLMQLHAQLLHSANSRYLSISVSSYSIANTLAPTDPLTGLQLLKSLEDYTSGLLEGALNVQLCLVDIARLATINQSYSKNAGDNVILAVAERLKSIFSDIGTVYRIEGNRFGVVIPGDSHMVRTSRAMDLLVTSLQLGIQLNAGHVVQAELYIGTSQTEHKATTNFTELWTQTEVALATAKKRGPSSIVYYSPELGSKNKRSAILETALKSALHEGTGLDVYFQPLVNKHGTIKSFESLLRWYHPELGPISPDEIIPIAEATGLILALGKYVFKTAVAQAMIWHSAGFNIKVAINMSPTELSNPLFMESIEYLIKAYSPPPGLIELEITETAVITDMQTSLVAINRLQALGINFSLDDFGAGCSNLAYLAQLSVKKLKLDKTLVDNIPLDKVQLAITRAVSGLCADLGLETVAEGIETKEQFDVLANLNYTLFQGYYFSKAVSAEEASHLLTLQNLMPT